MGCNTFVVTGSLYQDVVGLAPRADAPQGSMNKFMVKVIPATIAPSMADATHTHPPECLAGLDAIRQQAEHGALNSLECDLHPSVHSLIVLVGDVVEVVLSCDLKEGLAFLVGIGRAEGQEGSGGYGFQVTHGEALGGAIRRWIASELLQPTIGTFAPSPQGYAYQTVRNGPGLSLTTNLCGLSARLQIDLPFKTAQSTVATNLTVTVVTTSFRTNWLRLLRGKGSVPARLHTTSASTDTVSSDSTEIAEWEWPLMTSSGPADEAARGRSSLLATLSAGQVPANAHQVADLGLWADVLEVVLAVLASCGKQSKLDNSIVPTLVQELAASPLLVHLGSALLSTPPMPETSLLGRARISATNAVNMCAKSCLVAAMAAQSIVAGCPNPSHLEALEGLAALISKVYSKGQLNSKFSAFIEHGATTADARARFGVAFATYFEDLLDVFQVTTKAIQPFDSEAPAADGLAGLCLLNVADLLAPPSIQAIVDGLSEASGEVARGTSTRRRRLLEALPAIYEDDDDVYVSNVLGISAIAAPKPDTSQQVQPERSTLPSYFRKHLRRLQHQRQLKAQSLAHSSVDSTVTSSANITATSAAAFAANSSPLLKDATSFLDSHGRIASEEEALLIIDQYPALFDRSHVAVLMQWWLESNLSRRSNEQTTTPYSVTMHEIQAFFGITSPAATFGGPVAQQNPHEGMLRSVPYVSQVMGSASIVGTPEEASLYLWKSILIDRQRLFWSSSDAIKSSNALLIQLHLEHERGGAPSHPSMASLVDRSAYLTSYHGCLIRSGAVTSLRESDGSSEALLLSDTASPHLAMCCSAFGPALEGAIHVGGDWAQPPSHAWRTFLTTIVLEAPSADPYGQTIRGAPFAFWVVMHLSNPQGCTNGNGVRCLIQPLHDRDLLLQLYNLRGGAWAGASEDPSSVLAARHAVALLPVSSEGDNAPIKGLIGLLNHQRLMRIIYFTRHLRTAAYGPVPTGASPLTGSEIGDAIMAAANAHTSLKKVILGYASPALATLLEGDGSGHCMPMCDAIFEVSVSRPLPQASSSSSSATALVQHLTSNEATQRLVSMATQASPLTVAQGEVLDRLLKAPISVARLQPANSERPLAYVPHLPLHHFGRTQLLEGIHGAGKTRIVAALARAVSIGIGANANADNEAAGYIPQPPFNRQSEQTEALKVARHRLAQVADQVQAAAGDLAPEEASAKVQAALAYYMGLCNATYAFQRDAGLVRYASAKANGCQLSLPVIAVEAGEQLRTVSTTNVGSMLTSALARACKAPLVSSMRRTSFARYPVMSESSNTNSALQCEFARTLEWFRSVRSGQGKLFGDGHHFEVIASALLPRSACMELADSAGAEGGTLVGQLMRMFPNVFGDSTPIAAPIAAPIADGKDSQAIRGFYHTVKTFVEQFALSEPTVNAFSPAYQPFTSSDVAVPFVANPVVAPILSTLQSSESGEGDNAGERARSLYSLSDEELGAVELEMASLYLWHLGCAHALGDLSAPFIDNSDDSKSTTAMATATALWDTQLCVAGNELLIADPKAPARPVLRLPGTDIAAYGPILRSLVGNCSASTPFSAPGVVGGALKASGCTIAVSSAPFWESVWRGQAYNSSSGACHALTSFPDGAPVFTVVDDTDLLHACSYLHMPTTPDVMAVNADGAAQAYSTSASLIQFANDDKLANDVLGHMVGRMKSTTDSFSPPPGKSALALQPWIETPVMRGTAAAMRPVSAALAPSRGFYWRVIERMAAPALLPLLRALSPRADGSGPHPTVAHASHKYLFAAVATLVGGCQRFLQSVQALKSRVHSLPLVSHRFTNNQLAGAVRVLGGSMRGLSSSQPFDVKAMLDPASTVSVLGLPQPPQAIPLTVLTQAQYAVNRVDVSVSSDHAKPTSESGPAEKGGGLTRAALQARIEARATGAQVRAQAPSSAATPIGESLAVVSSPSANAASGEPLQFTMPAITELSLECLANPFKFEMSSGSIVNRQHASAIASLGAFDLACQAADPAAAMDLNSPFGNLVAFEANVLLWNPSCWREGGTSPTAALSDADPVSTPLHAAGFTLSECALIRPVVDQLISIHRGDGIDQKYRMLHMLGRGPRAPATSEESSVLVFRPSTRSASVTSAIEQATVEGTELARPALRHSVTMVSVCPQSADVTFKHLPLQSVIGMSAFASIVLLDDYKDVDTTLDGRVSVVQATHTTERYLCRLQSWLMLAASRARTGLIVVNPFRNTDIEASDQGFLKVALTDMEDTLLTSPIALALSHQTASAASGPTRTIPAKRLTIDSPTIMATAFHTQLAHYVKGLLAGGQLFPAAATNAVGPTHVQCPTLRASLPQLAFPAMAVSCRGHRKNKHLLTIEVSAADGTDASNDSPTTSGEALVEVVPRWLGTIQLPSGASVRPPSCEVICLKSYAGCPQRTHLCLRLCHASQSSVCCQEGDNGFNDEETSTVRHNLAALPEPHTSEVARHESCPYPCPKTLPCGHPCSSTCGQPCPTSCSRRVIVPRPCGQPIISGWDAATDMPIYTLFNHYIQVACGEQELFKGLGAEAESLAGAKRGRGGEPMGIDCQEPVTVRCRQCGTEQVEGLTCCEWQHLARFVAEGEPPNTVDLPRCPSCRTIAIDTRKKFAQANVIPDEGSISTESNEAYATKLASVYTLERRKAELRLKAAGMKAASSPQGPSINAAFAEAEALLQTHLAAQLVLDADEKAMHEDKGKAWVKAQRERLVFQKQINERSDVSTRNAVFELSQLVDKVRRVCVMSEAALGERLNGGSSIQTLAEVQAKGNRQ